MKLGKICMLAALVAMTFVPAAMANQNICVNGTAPPCVTTVNNSSGSADCSTAPSSQTQSATVRTGATPAGSYSATVRNSCSLNRIFGLTFGSSYLGASASGFGPAGFVSGQASWSTSQFGSFKSCQMSASVYSAPTGSQGTGNIGSGTPVGTCPAGGPPMLPDVLP